MLDNPVRQMRMDPHFGPKLEQLVEVRIPLMKLLHSSASVVWMKHRPRDLREITLELFEEANRRHEIMFGFRIYPEPRPFIERLSITPYVDRQTGTERNGINMVELFQALDRLWSLQIVAMEQEVDKSVEDFHLYLWTYANESHQRLVGFPIYRDYELFTSKWSIAR